MATLAYSKVFGDNQLEIIADPENFEFAVEEHGIILTNESSVYLNWHDVKELAEWLMKQLPKEV